MGEEMALSVLDQEWVDTYTNEVDAIWGELVRLNSFLRIIEEISDFPFHLFGDHGDYFCNLTLVSMSETCISIVWRTCFDTDADALTLPKLKNAIREHFVDDKCRSRFDRDLRDVQFETKIGNAKTKLHEIRNKCIAHLDRSWNVGPAAGDIGRRPVFLSDLKETCKAINTLFQVLCIGHGRAMTYIEYDKSIQHAVGMDPRSDIERLLDLVAEKNPLLRMPEEQPEFWPYYRTNLSTDDLVMLNRYREKFGLPPV